MVVLDSGRDALVPYTGRSLCHRHTFSSLPFLMHVVWCCSFQELQHGICAASWLCPAQPRRQ